MTGVAYVAGADTFIGRAITRRLKEAHRDVLSEPEPDLTDRGAVERFLQKTRPDLVFATAGRTAGIAGNQNAPADLMLDNLMIGANLISSSWKAGASKLLYLASSCVYPKAAPQPFSVRSLWTGPVEPTSNAYAVAKLAGIRLCEAYRRQHGVHFITAISADVYGPGDNFDPEHSHVAAALIRRIHEAKQSGQASVSIWGSGEPRREFIYVDDLADAAIFAMDRYDEDEPLNLGTGVTTTIAELAETIRQVVGYTGALQFDLTKPDGMPFKGLDSSRLNALGWKPNTTLKQGLEQTYRSFISG